MSSSSNAGSSCWSFAAISCAFDGSRINCSITARSFGDDGPLTRILVVPALPKDLELTYGTASILTFNKETKLYEASRDK